ncbi:amino acid permease [Amycolatopsis methanolica]|uniref:Arginine or ornithine antiporter ArcD n=1 Tax=Amycolatopsis methanolica 239 TaxID=1068978 RepID=A0A076MZK7_AMYME|nr:amino acid permease [Amycolatopsis methanolica]AIJ24346.1 arginine or ornithine antiporter ArcD [Amycolatopsis methanolica 239]
MSTAETTRTETAKFGVATMMAMVVGSMVGAGVFSLPHRFAAETGVSGALVAWLIAGAGMLTLAFVFQNLAVRKPGLDAGVYAYAKAGFGEYLTQRAAFSSEPRLATARRRASRKSASSLPTAGVSSHTETGAPSGTTPSASPRADREAGGAAATNSRRTPDAAITTPAIARPTSTIRRTRRAGADSGRLWFIPPLKAGGCCHGVCAFRYARDMSYG